MYYISIRLDVFWTCLEWNLFFRGNRIIYRIKVYVFQTLGKNVTTTP